MSVSKKIRDKSAEKTVKTRLAKTHLKSINILGSEVNEENVVVYVLRMVDTSNYLFKVNCMKRDDGGYELSGLIPVNGVEAIGDYRVYNPQFATMDVLKPTAKEKKFKGYA